MISRLVQTKVATMEILVDITNKKPIILFVQQFKIQSGASSWNKIFELSAARPFFAFFW